MSGLGLEGYDMLYDVACAVRKDGDVARFDKKLRKGKYVEEDYVQFLVLLYDYERHCQSYSTSKDRYKGVMVVPERLNHNEDHGDDKDKVESRQNGALKRRRKGETKNRSKKEQKTEKGRKSAHKEEAADVDEDNLFLPEKFMREQKVQGQPSDPLSPKKKKKRGRPSKKRTMKEIDTSKGEQKRTSSKKQTTREGWISENVTAAEEVVGRDLAIVCVKEEVPNVDETSSGHDFESQAPEEVLQILDKEGSFDLTEASSAKHYESLEDSCCPTQTVRSDFWWNVKALLERPYDQKEYVGLLKAVKKRKHITRNMDLRKGVKFYSTSQLGKSYLDHYKDLHEKLKEVDDDERKKLNILRGFFFWLQNLTHEGAFKPWTNPEWLSLVAKSSTVAEVCHGEVRN